MAVVLAQQSGWLAPSPPPSPPPQPLTAAEAEEDVNEAAATAAEAARGEPGDATGGATASSASEEAKRPASRGARLSPTHPLSLAVLNDFSGLRSGVNDFLWETFTTKPFHDAGEVKRIGEVRAPWSAFLIAARRELLDARAEDVRRLLDAISEATAAFVAGTASGASQAYVAATYQQQPADVAAWFATVHYPPSAAVVARPVLSTCLQSLRNARLVEHAVQPSALVDLRVAALTDTAPPL